MQGPYKTGSTVSPSVPTRLTWEVQNNIQRGKNYRVLKLFEDADGDVHAVGEEWEFVTGLFNKFQNEIIICVRDSAGREWKIPLIWTRQAQAHVIDNIEEYLEVL